MCTIATAKVQRNYNCYNVYFNECLRKEQGIEVYYKDKTVWCTQKAMGMLFDCSTDNVGLHLKNIFASGELVKDSVTEKISATASDGKNYVTQFYNLDAVISVGYRVNSILCSRWQ